MASQLARQFCQAPNQKGSQSQKGSGKEKNKNTSKENVLIKQTMWNYEDFVNPKIYNPPKKCFYKIMTKDDFMSHQRLCCQLSGCKKNKGCADSEDRQVKEENACTRKCCYNQNISSPEDNQSQKNSRYSKQAPMPPLQPQSQMPNECLKQRRFINNRVAANETAEKGSMQQQPAMSQSPTTQQQQRANQRPKSLTSSLCNAMNLQPRPGPGSVIPQATPPAEPSNMFNAFMPSNASKNKCQAQAQRCAQSQSPPPNQPPQPQQRCNYPQSQSPPPPSQQIPCLKNNRSPSPQSGTSSRPCTPSSTSTITGCPNEAQGGADTQNQGYALIPSTRPSQTGGQCVMKQQMPTSMSQPCPPSNYNPRPPHQMGRNRPNPGYNCNMANRLQAQFNQLPNAGTAGNMCAIPQMNLRKPQCVGMAPPGFQYDKQTNQNQMATQKFNATQNGIDMQSVLPPSEPVNEMHQPCSGPPQIGFNPCGNMYQKPINTPMRPNLPPPQNRGGRICPQYSTTPNLPPQCDNETWNRNAQQDCCYTSDTDNCDAEDGDNQYEDARGDAFNCECYSDTADEFCGNGGTITDEEQHCDTEFDEEYNGNECNQNNCTFQVQDYGHSNKEECLCGNQNAKTCIPDCSDNKVQVVIQIPQHLGRQEERKQEDDFDCARGIQGRNQSPFNTQTTQTSTNEARHDSREPQATCISLCPESDKSTQQSNNTQLPIILMPQPQKKRDGDTEKPCIKPEDLNTIRIYYNPLTFNIQSFMESVQNSKLIYYPPPQSFDPPMCPPELSVTQSQNLSSSPPQNNNPC